MSNICCMIYKIENILFLRGKGPTLISSLKYNVTLCDLGINKVSTLAEPHHDR